MIMYHLSAELLLGNDVFHSVLPQLRFPPQPRGQGGGKAGRLTQLLGADYCRLGKGDHGGEFG